MPITVIAAKCPQNHKCPAVGACPVKALTQDALAAPVVDNDLCTDCGRCTKICPTGALTLETE